MKVSSILKLFFALNAYSHLAISVLQIIIEVMLQRSLINTKGKVFLSKQRFRNKVRIHLFLWFSREQLLRYCFSRFLHFYHTQSTISWLPIRTFTVIGPWITGSLWQAGSGSFLGTFVEFHRTTFLISYVMSIWIDTCTKHQPGEKSIQLYFIESEMEFHSHVLDFLHVSIWGHAPK